MEQDATWSEETLAFLPCFPSSGDDSDFIEYQYGNENMLAADGQPLYRHVSTVTTP